MSQDLTESQYASHGHSNILTVLNTVSHRIVASLVRAQPVEFLMNILKWLLVAVPATWTNSWLSYIQNKLSLAYRTRLTEEVMKEYLGDDREQNNKIFYKLGMCRFICMFGALFIVMLQLTSTTG